MNKSSSSTSNPGAGSTVANYKVSTLEDTPRRALELLRGIGSSPTILRIMSGAGYTVQVHEEGQRLLSKVVSFVEEKRAFRTVTSATHIDATSELAKWNKSVFRRLRAAIVRFFPAKAESLFANLEVSSDLDAPLVAQIFLDRLAAIESEAKGTKGGSAFHKMLAERGFGPKEIRDLRKLIETAQAPAPEAPDTAEAETAAKREERLGLLRDLRAWYDDWAETARTVLVRKDHAIRVGLAHRKPARRAVVAAPAPAPVKAPVLAMHAADDTAPESRAA